MTLELGVRRPEQSEIETSLFVFKGIAEKIGADKKFKTVFPSIYRVLSASASFVHRKMPVRSLNDIPLIREDLEFDQAISKKMWTENDLNRVWGYLDNLFEEIRFMNENRKTAALTPYETSLLRAQLFDSLKLWLANERGEDIEWLVSCLIRMRGKFVLESRSMVFDDGRSAIPSERGISKETMGRIGINVLVEQFGLRKVLYALYHIKPSYLQAMVVLSRLGYITGWPMTNSQIRQQIMGAKTKEDKTQVLRHVWEDVLTDMWQVLANEEVKEGSLSEIERMLEKTKQTEYPFKIKVGTKGKQRIKILPPKTARHEIARLYWWSPETFMAQLRYLPINYRKIINLALAEDKNDGTVFAYSNRELALIIFPGTKYRLLYLEQRLRKIIECLRGDIFMDTRGQQIKNNSSRFRLYQLYPPQKGLPPFIDELNEQKRKTLTLLYQCGDNGGLLPTQEIAESLGIRPDALMLRIKRILRKTNTDLEIANEK